MPNFYMLCGIPSSGKSFYISENMSTDVSVVSSDAIRLEFTGSEEDFHMDATVFRVAKERIIDNMNAGTDVVFDACNINRKYRMDFLEYIRLHVKNICLATIIVIEPNINTSLAFQETRTRKVPREVIESFARRFQYPILAEGWDVIQSEIRNFTVQHAWEYQTNLEDKSQIHIQSCSKAFLDHIKKLQDTKDNTTFDLDEVIDQLKEKTSIFQKIKRWLKCIVCPN